MFTYRFENIEINETFVLVEDLDRHNGAQVWRKTNEDEGRATEHGQGRSFRRGQNVLKVRV